MAKAKETASTQEQTETASDDKKVVADKLIRNCSLASIGAGIFPIPVVDLVALGGVQVYLVRELCKIYEIPFKKERVKGILGAIAGGTAPLVALPATVALAKFIPGIGTLAASVAMPGLSAASTVAFGRIFQRHFAAGGSLDDVDVDAMKTEYKEEVGQANEESAEKTARKTAKEAAAAA